MRWLALALLVAFAGVAEAKRVVRMPTLGNLCPAGPDWEKMSTCFKRQGKPELLRDEPNLKLVRFAPGIHISGIYLYTLAGKHWQLRGEYRLFQDHDLLAFERVAFGKHAGYRIDLGFAMWTTVSIDGETALQVLLRQKRSMICLDELGCVHAMTACDTLWHGKAVHTFRGKLQYDAGMLRVTGDRANAGLYCQQPEDVYKLD